MTPNNCQTLYHASMVKGYLADKSAPKTIREAIDAVIAAFLTLPKSSEESESDINNQADEKPPLALIEHTEKSPPPKRAIDPQQEESEDSRSANSSRSWEQWQKDRVLELKAAGTHTSKQIGQIVGKTQSQVNTMYYLLRKAGAQSPNATASQSPGEA